jgi:hypothetical protein
MHHTGRRPLQSSLAPALDAQPHSHVLLNHVITMILRSPLHGLLSQNLMLISLTGRRTGRRYTFPVTYLTRDNGIIVFSNQRWWKNLRGGAAVTLRLQGREVAAFARPVEEAATVAREARLFLQQKGVRAAAMINLRLDRRRQPTDAEIADSTRGHVVVDITFLPAERAV